jgi:hypothetical protein
VTNIWDNQYKPGFYKVHWDGRSSYGRRVTSGSYLLSLEIDGKNSIYKRVIKN